MYRDAVDYCTDGGQAAGWPVPVWQPNDGEQARDFGSALRVSRDGRRAPCWLPRWSTAISAPLDQRPLALLPRRPPLRLPKASVCAVTLSSRASLPYSVRRISWRCCFRRGIGAPTRLSNFKNLVTFLISLHVVHINIVQSKVTPTQ